MRMIKHEGLMALMIVSIIAFAMNSDAATEQEYEICLQNFKLKTEEAQRELLKIRTAQCRYFDEPCKQVDIHGNPFRMETELKLDTPASTRVMYAARNQANKCMQILDELEAGDE